jgi:hypothetical protein
MPGHPEGYCPRPAFDFDQVIDIWVVLRICSACQSIMPTFYAHIYTYTTPAHYNTMYRKKPPYRANTHITPAPNATFSFRASPVFHEDVHQEVLYAPPPFYVCTNSSIKHGLVGGWCASIGTRIGLGEQKTDALRLDILRMDAVNIYGILCRGSRRRVLGIRTSSSE